MSGKSDKPLRFKRKASKKQQFWGFMRRNPTFRVGDVMAILEVSKNFCKQTLWYLEECGYVRLENDAKGRYEDRVYTLLKNTGVKAPSMVGNRLYDYNEDKEYEIFVPKRADMINLIYSAIEPEGTKIGEIIKKTGLNRSTAKRWLTKMLKMGIIRKAPRCRYERRQ